MHRSRISTLGKVLLLAALLIVITPAVSAYEFKPIPTENSHIIFRSKHFAGIVPEVYRRDSPHGVQEYVTYFKGTNPGSKAFSAKWRLLARESSSDQSGIKDTFAEAQHEFIKRTHYDPVRKHATSKGIIDHHAVNQVLWSMGVQHGRAKSIVTTAANALGVEQYGNSFIPAQSFINSLYDAREAYVKRIKLPNNTRKSLLNRYKGERKDALVMVEL